MTDEIPAGFHESADRSIRCNRCHLHPDQCRCHRGLDQVRAKAQGWDRLMQQVHRTVRRLDRARGKR